MKTSTFIFYFTTLFFAIACSSTEQKNGTKDSLTDLSDSTLVDKNSIVVAQKDSTIPLSLNSSALAKSINYKGDFKEAWTWYDLNGANFLVLSSNRITKKGDENFDDENTQELFAKHYVIRSSNLNPELLWEMYDLEKECAFDLTADFILSPVITDLDNDGIKESFIVYKLACRSDVSPARMKVVVHENKNKYTLRGSMYIKMNPEEDSVSVENWEPNLSKFNSTDKNYSVSWGRYENEKEFISAPVVFLDKAKALWLENFIETL